MKNSLFAMLLLVMGFCSVEGAIKKRVVSKVKESNLNCNYYQFKSPNGKKIYYIKECDLK